MGGNLIVFKPEHTTGAEGERWTAVSADSGLIEKTGNPREMSEWLAAAAARGDVVAEEHIGGALLPAMTEGHNHTLVYSTFEMLNAASMLGCKDKEDALKRLKSAAARIKEPGRPAFAVALDTSKVPDLTRADIDEALGGAPAFVLDISLHSGIVSSAMAARVSAAAAAFNRPLAGELKDNGFVSEEYTMRALEVVESDQPQEKISAAIERKLASYFEKGVTTAHDLMPATTNQFIAALRLRKKWKEEKPFGFPITKFYLNKFQIMDVLSRIGDLESEGLMSREEMRGLIGIKMFADGAFGAHTAKVATPYADTGGTGMFFTTAEEMRADIKWALETGLQHAAMHAIGDAGIGLAIEGARAWAELAPKFGAGMNFRIEHFQMPLPVAPTIEAAKAAGAWLCMQPNFLLDYNYADRLGDRVKEMCPHEAVAASGIPLFFGTDGMPDSMLFGIWLATHAAHPPQRMSPDACIEAACAEAARFEGVRRGRIADGFAADLILADAKLIGELDTPTEPDGSMSMMKMFELEGHIKKVFKDGSQVYPKKKPAAK